MTGSSTNANTDSDQFEQKMELCASMMGREKHQNIRIVNK